MTALTKEVEAGSLGNQLTSYLFSLTQQMFTGAFCVPGTAVAPIKKAHFPCRVVKRCLFLARGHSRLYAWLRGKRGYLRITVSLCLSLPICAMICKVLEGYPRTGIAQVGNLCSCHTAIAVYALCQPLHIPLTFKKASSEHRSQNCILHRVFRRQLEHRGVLKSQAFPGEEEEVPDRQSLQGGLGGAGLPLPRKEERSPN